MYSEDVIACAKLVERGDPLRFRAVMAAPSDLRPALFTLFAFNLEVARAPWVTKEAMIAEMRLQWWHDALSEIANGDVVRRHEVVTPLAYYITSDQARLLQDLVDARRWDIYADPFADKEAFDRYLLNTSGNLYAVGAGMLGPCDLDIVKRLGAAFGFAQFIQAIPALQNAGKRPLDDGRAETIAERAAIVQGALARVLQGRDGLHELRKTKGRTKAFHNIHVTRAQNARRNRIKIARCVYKIAIKGRFICERIGVNVPATRIYQIL